MKKYKKLLFNKWTITTIVFLFYMIFFMPNNFIIHKRLSDSVKTLHKERDFYQKQIDRDSQLLKMLEDSRQLEKYGREKYLMKKENEDIFLVVEEVQED